MNGWMGDGDLVTVRCSGAPFRENYHHTDMVKLPITCMDCQSVALHCTFIMHKTFSSLKVKVGKSCFGLEKNLVLVWHPLLPLLKSNCASGKIQDSCYIVIMVSQDRTHFKKVNKTVSKHLLYFSLT